MTEPLLEMRNVSVTLPVGDEMTDIVSDISFVLNRGERLGIVGESGSGKSITALAAMGLLPDQMSVNGTLRFDGQDLLKLPEAELCKLRGRRMAMIFQEPMTALNPLKSIGAQVAEGRRLHFGENRADAERKACVLLERVGLPAPRFNLGLYPHQLSGGQRQRVMIAMAIACEPDLLIADEPTTALDVTTQAKILDLLDELIDESGMALMLITHDLGVVSEMTDRMAVMYSGRIVETGATETVFQNMAHPYTRSLFTASPHSAHLKLRQRLANIPGTVPDTMEILAHCSFAERCAFVEDDCRALIPALDLIETVDAVEHKAACLHPRSDGDST